MTRLLAKPPLGARYECGGPCKNCAEPVVRSRVDGQVAPSRWLHTPNRLHCIDQLTRQELLSVAEFAEPTVLRDPVRTTRPRTRGRL
ncbi:hypothetical protein AB0K35_28455 [Micromonospora sp. NPDC053740]|uniref:hypothetical protein n=1 Tax=Micromonospora sp. NPDC053740 TaxID=3155173 RepID=UPI00342AB460